MADDPQEEHRRQRELARHRSNYLRAVDALGAAMAGVRGIVLDPDSPAWTRGQRDTVAAAGRAWWELLGYRRAWDEARERYGGPAE